MRTFCQSPYGLTFFLSFPEHLNVTTLLGLSIMSSPVAGFLPLSFSLLVHTELSEPTDKDILAGGEGTFDDFDEGFGDI